MSNIKPRKKIAFEPFFVFIIVIFAFIGGGYGLLRIKSNLSPEPKNIQYLVVNQNGHGADTLKVVYKNQFADTVSTKTDSLATVSNTSKKIHMVPIENTLYHQNVSFLAWSMLIFIMIGIAAGSLPYFGYEAWNLKKGFAIPIGYLITGTLGSIVFAIGAIILSSQGAGLYKPGDFMNDMGVLLTNGNVLMEMVTVTILLQVPIISTVFLIPFAANRINANKEDKESIINAANQFESLQKTLKKCLHVIAILVVLSGLTTSALAASIKDTIEIAGFEIFPNEISFAYGLLFSFLLAIMYIPVHAYIRYKSRSLVDNLEQSITDEDVRGQFEKVRDKALVEQGTLQSLQVAFTVIAPIVTSFLPSFIP